MVIIDHGQKEAINNKAQGGKESIRESKQAKRARGDTKYNIYI
jgi:hypothetical protein